MGIAGLEQFPFFLGDQAPVAALGRRRLADVGRRVIDQAHAPLLDGDNLTAGQFDSRGLNNRSEEQTRYGDRKENGGQGQNRTADTGIFSPLLYRLSYLAELCI